MSHCDHIIAVTFFRFTVFAWLVMLVHWVAWLLEVFPIPFSLKCLFFVLYVFLFYYDQRVPVFARHFLEDRFGFSLD